MRLYTGITGLSGTGKSTFAKFLMEFAEQNGFSTQSYNLSDEVRRELVRRGRDNEVASRKTLIDVANELRSTYSPRVLAERIIAQDIEKSLCNGQPSLVIVTGIRSPSEVNAFRSAWASHFLLVAVEAAPGSRFARMSERRQYCEDIDPLQEVELADQAIGILDCVRLSDHTIPNDGAIDQLQQSAKIFLIRVVVPLLDGLRQK